MEKMMRRFAAVFAAALLLFTAACGKKNGASETASTAVDLVQHVTDTAVSGSPAAMTSEEKAAYAALLANYPDSGAGYFLYDLTGDGNEELIVGGQKKTVYAYIGGKAEEMGTVLADKVYVSETYGFLAYSAQGDMEELRLYFFKDGELVEQVVLHTDKDEEFKKLLKTYQKDAVELPLYQTNNHQPLT